MRIFGSDLSQIDLARRTGHLRQVAGISLGAYADGPERGVRYLDVRSGSGLELRVLVDRGMDIGELRLDGVPLSWRSATGFRSPSHWNGAEDDGMGLLRSFDGFLVTCGLDHVRGADVGGGTHFGGRRPQINYPMHGRIAMAPARLTGYGEAVEGERCTIWCEGVVSQTMLYGEHLVLTRRIGIEMGTSEIEIVDRVENHGFHSVPHMMLYHLNTGFPLLDENAELLIAGQFCETGNSPQKLASLQRQCPPAGPSAADEIVDLAETKPGRSGPAAAIINPELRGGMALAIDFEPSTFPNLQIWRNLSDGIYALAVEPALQPFGKREALESAGLIGWLQPRDSVEHRLLISAMAGEEAIDDLQAKMTTI